MRESAKCFPAAERAIATTNDSRGSFARSQEIVRNHLRKTPPRQTLVCGCNDPAALGALRAFEETGAASNCLVVGQNAVAEARQELHRAVTRFVATVTYFPERYGDELILLALQLVAGKATPPAIFVEHELVTPNNVDKLYPAEKSLLTGANA